MAVQVKICGISSAGSAHTAAEAGATYLGFMFFQPSPRHLTWEAAKTLEPDLPRGPDAPQRVGVFVDADDHTIEAAVNALNLDWLQLHGHETPDHVADLKTRFGLPVIKAVGVKTVSDIESTQPHYSTADMMLFDAKPPKGAVLPGGNAISFPWEIMTHAPLPSKWMLAGGLTPENVPDAVKVSRAKILDVSSGVETFPGVKSDQKIEAFLQAAKAAR